MSTPIRILGIDPGLRFTGWGVIESDGVRLSYLACGTVKTQSADTLSRRLKHVYLGLETILEEWRPHEVAIEQTFVNRDGASTLKLGQARGVAMLVPALVDVPVAEYAPNVVKKTVVGSGHAEKEQIRAMIGYLMPKAAPKTADAADALAIAITHAHQRHVPALLRVQDKRAVGR